MNALTFYTIFDVITVFLLLFFSAFLVTLKKGSMVSHRLLAVFLVALAISYMDGVNILFGDFFYHRFPHLLYVNLSFDFLVGPALFLFIRSKTTPSFRLRPIDALHALPFVAHFLFLTARYHRFSADAKRALLQTGEVLHHTEIVVLVIASHLHFFVYGLLALRLLAAYRARLSDDGSSRNARSFSWLSTVTLGLFLVWGLRLLNSLLWLHVPDAIVLQYVDIRPVLVVGVFVFACMIFFKALREPDVIHYEETVKYRNALLSNTDRNDYLARLRSYMEQEKPYLDPSFDLKALAEGAALQPHYVSQVLNEGLNQNFFEFVNRYRIEESRRILADERHAKKSIAEVMYEAGFNSKSVFNTAFKKYTDMTPSQFRKVAAQQRRLHSTSENGVHTP